MAVLGRARRAIIGGLGVRAAALCLAAALPASIVSALRLPEGELYEIYTPASRQASLACGFTPFAVHSWFDSRRPREYPPNNVSLGCSMVACRDPDRNPAEICVRDWAAHEGYVYKDPPLCTYECGL